MFRVAASPSGEPKDEGACPRLRPFGSETLQSDKDQSLQFEVSLNSLIESVLLKYWI